MNSCKHALGVADKQLPRSWVGQGHQADATQAPRQATPSSAGFTWEPTCRREDTTPANWPRKLAEATPASTTLLRWAASPTSQPPQAWWEDTTDPFAIDAD